MHCTSPAFGQRKDRNDFSEYRIIDEIEHEDMAWHTQEQRSELSRMPGLLRGQCVLDACIQKPAKLEKDECSIPVSGGLYS